MLCWQTNYPFFCSILTRINCLLYYTKNYIHRLSTYLAFHPNKIQLYWKFWYKKSFKCIWKKNLLQIVQKFVSGNHMMYIQKEHAQTDSLQALKLGHFCTKILLVCLPNSSKSPWVTEQNYKKKHSGRRFIYKFYVQFKPNLMLQLPINTHFRFML